MAELAETGLGASSLLPVDLNDRALVLPKGLLIAVMSELDLIPFRLKFRLVVPSPEP